MSDVDSQLSEDEVDEVDAVRLEDELRHVVHTIQKGGKEEELTVNRVRKAAEENLNLREGFFKEAEWKDKSKAIIQAAAEEDETQASPQETAPKTNKKRTSPVDRKPRKRLRASREDDDVNSTAIDNSAGTEGAETKRKKMQPTKPLSESDISAAGGSNIEAAQPPCITSKAGSRGDQSESEMSVVIDDDPPLKRKKKKSDPGKPKLKANIKDKAQAKKEKTQGPADPDAEEIKRLQGWLVKCGIRKMWFKELASYDSPKAKIRHLKQMLEDAGMTGRYSQEKATQIKEARELQADLEAVQEGAKHWGKIEQEEAKDVKPRRRLAKGLEGLDFLNSDDGEETD